MYEELVVRAVELWSCDVRCLFSSLFLGFVCVWTGGETVAEIAWQASFFERIFTCEAFFFLAGGSWVLMFLTYASVPLSSPSTVAHMSCTKDYVSAILSLSLAREMRARTL